MAIDRLKPGRLICDSIDESIAIEDEHHRHPLEIALSTGEALGRGSSILLQVIASNGDSPFESNFWVPNCD